MTLDPELHRMLNEQVRNEMASSYNYLAMSAWFEKTPYAGFAQWMYVQSLEETDHAMKFFRFIVDRDADVHLDALEKPRESFSSPLDVFKASLQQEQAVTQQIHLLYSKSQEVHDHQTKTFLNWFLDEQVEEEKTIRDVIDRLDLVGDNPVGLLQIDQEAAQRKPLDTTAPADGV